MHKNIHKVMHTTLRPVAFLALSVFGMMAAGCAQRPSDFLSDAPYYQTSGRPADAAPGQD